MAKQYIAICPCCETFYSVSPEYRSRPYLCGCNVIHTLRTSEGEPVLSYVNNVDPFVECKIIAKDVT